MAIVTDSISATISWDDAKLEDPKICFAAIYNYQSKIKDPAWTPSAGQTQADRPLIDNPETKKAFMKRKIGEYILAVMKQHHSSIKIATATSTVESDFVGASVA